MEGTDQSSKLRIVRGVIETHDGKKIVGTFPDSIEKVPINEQSLSSIKFPLTAFHSYEVAMIRVYFFNDEWHLSTSRKLDAFDSYWASSVSFGRQFELLIERISGISELGLDTFLHSLDKNKKYIFLSPLQYDQRCGTTQPAPKDIFWLAGVQTGDGDIVIEPTEDKNLWSILPKTVFETSSELLDYFNNQPASNIELTGFMVCAKDKFVRLVGEDYLYRFNLRNNEPDVRKRYLEIIASNNQPDNDIFYDQHKDTLQPFCKDLDALVVYAHSKYIERFIHKKYHILPKRIHVLLKACHGEYIKDRTTRITVDRIEAILIATFPPRFILNILEELNH